MQLHQAHDAAPGMGRCCQAWADHFKHTPVDQHPATQVWCGCMGWRGSWVSPKQSYAARTLRTLGTGPREHREAGRGCQHQGLDLTEPQAAGRWPPDGQQATGWMPQAGWAPCTGTQAHSKSLSSRITGLPYSSAADSLEQSSPRKCCTSRGNGASAGALQGLAWAASFHRKRWPPHSGAGL